MHYNNFFFPELASIFFKPLRRGLNVTEIYVTIIICTRQIVLSRKNAFKTNYTILEECLTFFHPLGSGNGKHISVFEN